jgi:hypothetical protein
MGSPLVSLFQNALDAAYERLRRIQDPERKRTAWTSKQIVGHLIDSALNNHQRFVRAALDGRYDGPGYDGDRWQAIHDYAGMAWEEVLEHWRLQNALLARVVARIPKDCYGVEIRIPAWPAPLTLEALILDYVKHLEHHVTQAE